jgi:hypothetical protein
MQLQQLLFFPFPTPYTVITFEIQQIVAKGTNSSFIVTKHTRRAYLGLIRSTFFQFRSIFFRQVVAALQNYAPENLPALNTVSQPLL